MGKATIIEHLGDDDTEKIGLYKVTHHYTIPADSDIKSYLSYLVPNDPEIEIWCADFTWDLAEIPDGETENKIVGTLEVFGEVGKSRRNKEYEGIVQIAPAYNNSADYLESVFGRLIPAIAQNPYQYFYNTAMLPGHQRWRPLYRYGKITKINSSKTRATVEIEKAYSLTGKGTKNILERALTAKGKTLDDMPGLNINYEKDVENRESYHIARRTNILNADYEMELENVPFSYMSCDGKAFEIDDIVLIKFRDSWDKTKKIGWGNPQIIGFKKQPKPCPFVFYCQNTTDNSLWGMTAGWKWVKVAESPIPPPAEGQPGGFWNSLGWDGDNYFVMTYTPSLTVWKLGKHGVGGWTEMHMYGEEPFGTFNAGYHYGVQSIFTSADNGYKFYLRPYLDDFIFRDLLSFNSKTGEWQREALFENSGSRLNQPVGQYYYHSCPAWDGERMISVWKEENNSGGQEYWSWYYNLGVGYWGMLMVPDSVGFPSRILYANGSVYAAAGADPYDPQDMDGQNTTNALVKNYSNNAAGVVALGPGFVWQEEAISTGHEIVCRNNEDLTVWRFNGVSWEKVADAPDFIWNDMRYVGYLQSNGKPEIDDLIIRQFPTSFLFVCKNEDDGMVWGCTLQLVWLQLSTLLPGDVITWRFLAWTGNTNTNTELRKLLAMSFTDTTAKVYEFNGAGWTDFEADFPIGTEGVPIYPDMYMLQPIWTGDTKHEIWCRFYFSDTNQGVLYKLDITTKTWTKLGDMAHTGAQTATGATYDYTDQYACWDGSKMWGLWTETNSTSEDSIYFTTFLPTPDPDDEEAVFYDMIEVDDETPDAIILPVQEMTKLLYIDGKIVTQGNPNFPEYEDKFPILKKNTDSDGFDVVTINADADFKWGEECICSGNAIYCKKGDTAELWQYRESEWSKISNGPGYVAENQVTQQEEIPAFTTWTDMIYIGENLQASGIVTGTLTI